MAISYEGEPVGIDHLNTLNDGALLSLSAACHLTHWQVIVIGAQCIDCQVPRVLDT